ncbi:MAG: hypothetical protein H6825_01045 [Planctomycetes bacterium]|nr:hypothetical protein [Planctomycetota bacterium]
MARRLFLLALALGVAYAMWTALRDLPAEIDALPELVPPTEGAAPPMRLDATPAREDARDATLPVPEPPPDAPEAAAVDATPLVVHVRLASGEPALVRGFLRAGRELLDVRTSEPAGLLRFEGRDDAVSLVLCGATWRPKVVEFERGRGEHDVELETGARLSGRITLDGRAPGRPFAFQLSPAGEGWPGDFRFRPPGDFDSWPRNPLLTDADGRFAVDGLPDDWTGELRPSGSLCELAPDTDAHVAAGQRDVLVAFVTRACVSGRVVDAERRGVPACPLDVTDEEGKPRAPGADPHISSAGSRSTTIVTDAEGRFRIPFQIGDKQLTLHAEHALGRLDWSGGPFPYGVPVDLGDLPLVAARDVTISVRDPDGRPVRGAVARRLGNRVWSPPTDAEGQGLLRAVGEGDRAFEVVALHHERGEFEFPAPDEDAHVDVVLQPSAWLTIDLDLLEGVDRRLLDVRIVCDGEVQREPDLAPLDALPRAVRPEAAGPNAQAEFEDGTRWLTWERGSVPGMLDDLRPGALLSLHVLDAVDADVVPPRTLVVERGRAYDERLRVDTPPVALDLRVLDPAGHPLPDVQVLVRGATGVYGTSWRTDADGRVHLAATWARVLWLTLARGDAAGSLEVAVPRGGGEIVLEVPDDPAALSDATIRVR